MSAFIARIALALLMLPLATVVYLMVVALLLAGPGRRNDEAAFAVASLFTGAFVGAYWITLWRRIVHWTPQRVLLTALAPVAALIVSLPPSALLAGAVDPSFGVFLSGVIVILLWLAATVFIWRESPNERLDRLRGAGIASVACPACGYNMTGLQVTACPECGARFTLDQVVNATLESRRPLEEA